MTEWEKLADDIETCPVEEMGRLLKIAEGAAQRARERIQEAKDAVGKSRPSFARLGSSGSVMRLCQSTLVGYPKGAMTNYFRHAGLWGVESKWVGDKLISVSHVGSCDGLELIRATRQEYFDDNAGYV